jgi:hypothetical protein
LLSGDLTVSFVPPPEQRDWRLLSRTQITLTSVRRKRKAELVGNVIDKIYRRSPNPSPRSSAWIL